MQLTHVTLLVLRILMWLLDFFGKSVDLSLIKCVQGARTQSWPPLSNSVFLNLALYLNTVFHTIILWCLHTGTPHLGIARPWCGGGACVV